MVNLVWGELQSVSPRTSQPHIGSDGRGTNHNHFHSQPRDLNILGRVPEIAGFYRYQEVSNETGDRFRERYCTCEAVGAIIGRGNHPKFRHRALGAYNNSGHFR